MTKTPSFITAGYTLRECLDLLDAGYTLDDCVELLCDGQALAALGMHDTQEVEEAYNYFLSLNTSE